MIDKRMMYAQGQRVAKTLDGSRPGYRGDDAARSSEGTSGGRADPGNSPQGDGPERGGNGGDNRPDRTNPNPERSTSFSPAPTPIQVVDTKINTPLTQTSTDPLDIKEQYRLGTKINPPSAFTNNYSVTFDQPYMTKGLETIRNDNYIDRLNLQGETYKPPNLPPFIPGSTLIKTLGSFGFDKNKDFFAQNVAGKYGFGYGLKDFQKYMEQRALGKVGAYGTPFTAEELRNQVGGGDGGNNNTGIMTVDNTVSDNGDGDADGDGDVDQTDDFIFRYFDKTGESLQAGAGGVEDLMKRIRERLSNIFTT